MYKSGDKIEIVINFEDKTKSFKGDIIDVVGSEGKISCKIDNKDLRDILIYQPWRISYKSCTFGKGDNTAYIVDIGSEFVRFDKEYYRDRKINDILGY